MIEEKLNPVLVANLKALDERQPLFAQKVRDYMKNAKERFSINARETPRGTWWSGLYEQPFFEPKSCLDATPEGTKPVLIMAGLGSPRYLTGILNNSKKRQTIVLLEPNMKVMLLALESIPFFSENGEGKLFFAIEDDIHLVDELLKNAFHSRGFFVGGLFDVHSHPGESELNSQLVNSLLKTYVSRINYQMQRLGDSAEDSLLGFRQMALAAPWILSKPRLSDLKGKFSEFKGVVLSAGPSLDKNIHMLKGLEGRVIIVAADTLMSKLSSMGIRPHFVCALERGVATYEKYFRPLYARNEPSLEDIILVAQSVCVPQIFGMWPGRVCVVGKDTINMDKEIIGNILSGTLITSGSSVAHMGMALLDYLGAKQIALVGQDLAFGEDGKTHTRETTWDNEAADVVHEKRIQVPGALGGTVETTPSWKFFIDIFTELMPDISCPVWDCTEGGALIPGAEPHPLSEFLSDIQGAKDSYSEVDRVFPSVSRSTDLDMEEVLLKLKDLRQRFERSEETISKGEAILGEIEISDIPGRKDRALALMGILTELVGENPILTYLGQSYIAMLLAEQASVDIGLEEDISHWVSVHREFFEAQRKVSRIFLSWLKHIEIFASNHSELSPLLSLSGDREAVESRLKALLSSDEDISNETRVVSIDCLHAQFDALSSDWDVPDLWEMGRHLSDEGRYYEASVLFHKATMNLEGSQIPVSLASELLKERAKSLMGRDLCWVGDHREALVSLANAFRYAPDDPETVELLKELLSKRRQDLQDMILKETSNLNAVFLESTVEALGKELDRLASDGAADVVSRYLISILEDPLEK